MSDAHWAQRPRPTPGRASSTIGRWSPATPADLTAYRMQLAAVLHDGARPPAAQEADVECLLLAFEELVSNGLRHGRSPVEVVVTTVDTGWLLEVTDAAAATPPVPAVGRDAAQGGLGLHLVAQLCAAHGWTTEGDRKVVWARVDFAADAASRLPRGVLPHPRGEDERRNCWS